MNPGKSICRLLISLALMTALAGCAGWKPMEHSIKKHWQYHHGPAAKQRMHS